MDDDDLVRNMNYYLRYGRNRVDCFPDGADDYGKHPLESDLIYNPSPFQQHGLFKSSYNIPPYVNTEANVRNCTVEQIDNVYPYFKEHTRGDYNYLLKAPGPLHDYDENIPSAFDTHKINLDRPQGVHFNSAYDDNRVKMDRHLRGYVYDNSKDLKKPRVINTDAYNKMNKFYN